MIPRRAHSSLEAPIPAMFPATDTNTSKASSILPPLPHLERIAEDQRMGRKQQQHQQQRAPPYIAAAASETPLPTQQSRLSVSTLHRTTTDRPSGAPTPAPSALHATGARGSRHAVPNFAGVVRRVPDDARPPLCSSLPDLTNWRAPGARAMAIRERMAAVALSTPRRFEEPFKSPVTHPTIPVPTLAQRYQAVHDEATKKQHGVKKGWSRPISTKELVDGAALTTIIQRLTPRHFADHDASSARRDGSVYDAAAGQVGGTTRRSEYSLGGLTSMTAASVGSRSRRADVLPNGRVSTDLVEAELVGDAVACNAEINDFERSIVDKLVISQLMDSKKKLIPIMVVKHFRQQLCLDSPIANRIRHLPLKQIEHWIEELGPRTITSAQWVAILARLLGDAQFSHLDAQALFGLFDVDGGGDIDHRELCNGLVMILSEDGPMVPVLQRCKTLLQAHVKDTRLAFMTRFELVLMADAIRSASANKLRDGDRERLDEELKTLLNRYTTNKRGQFPFDDVRDAVTRSRAICLAINSFTVPREPALHKSPLSQFFRGDADEGEMPFRLMMSPKSLEKASIIIGHVSQLHKRGGGAEAGRSGGAASQGAGGLLRSDRSAHHLGGNGAPPPSLGVGFDASAGSATASAVGGASGGDDQLLGVGGAGYRPSSSGDFSPEDEVARALYIPETQKKKKDRRRSSLKASASEVTIDFGTGSTSLDSTVNGLSTTVVPPPAAAPVVVVPPPPMDDDDDDGDELLQRDVEEPEAPQFFTLRGTLFRKLAGQDPEIYHVPGLYTNVKYSEGRLRV